MAGAKKVVEAPKAAKKGRTIASLAIVATAATKQALAELGRPLVDVTVQGQVKQDASGAVLLLENISTSKTFPMVASAAARDTLVRLASAGAASGVTIRGRVVDAGGNSVLMLDRVLASKAVAIVASPDSQAGLAGLANAADGDEVTIKARVTSQAGAKVLVLDSVSSK